VALDARKSLESVRPPPTQQMSKNPSASNTPAESSTPASLPDADLERLLNREASAIQRELEVDRILTAFKLKSVFHFVSSTCSLCSAYISRNYSQSI